MTHEKERGFTAEAMRPNNTQHRGRTHGVEQSTLTDNSRPRTWSTEEFFSTPKKRRNTGNIFIKSEANEIDRIRSTLDWIPADDRETWLKVGMALHSGLGESGLLIWDDWSKKSAKYNRKDLENSWKSFKAGKGITIKTLFHEAVRYGWRDKSKNLAANKCLISRRGSPYEQCC